ncbi:RNA polymerase sigma factor [Fodinibius sediminis]|uniref:RNA polymerase sigma-70 factor, ECF subfamily n=1 Tax=Fodinibius sediminis TaxID=1214077 RepID=A0A521DHZ9_9BACT|nr:RNA polymerase sigma-70 factor [Fodinibius sediminis]SMO71202.1 RNA polymerase sigma-70 factor, ECF subfamily [Fodinibius sediminis]
MDSAHKFSPLPTDKTLVEQIRNSNKEAFEKLFRRYYSGLHRFLWGYVQNSQVAEDMVQEVFVRVWENRGELNPNEKVKNYLYKVGRNLAIDHSRHKKIVREWEKEKKALHSYSSDKKRVDEKLHNKFMLKEVKKAIEELPSRRRLVFILSRYEGMTYKEIAKELDISVNTVDTQICRALQTLRDKFSSFL